MVDRFFFLSCIEPVNRPEHHSGCRARASYSRMLIGNTYLQTRGERRQATAGRVNACVANLTNNNPILADEEVGRQSQPEARRRTILAVGYGKARSLTARLTVTWSDPTIPD